MLTSFDDFLNNNEHSFSVNDSKLHNVLVFAFVGDAVFTLFVRSFFSVNSTYKTGRLHSLTSNVINAGFQSKILDEIENEFTTEEQQIINTARNVKTNNVAKNSNLEDYKKATSFEAVLGYLYLTKQTERLKKILDLCLIIMEKKNESWRKKCGLWTFKFCTKS